MSVWRDLLETVRPPPDSRDGPLPPLMLALTVVTGLVDATSYLRLGHVFVANMTGNVVFLGFAIAGAPGLSLVASIAAIAAFLAGGLLGAGSQPGSVTIAASCCAPRWASSSSAWPGRPSSPPRPAPAPTSAAAPATS